MNPWDVHAALFAKHAQHVVLIHFPIALFLTGVMLDLAGTWSGRKDLIDSAYVTLKVAAFSALPAVATGLMAWQWELEGRRLKGILLLHLISGAASLVFMLATFWVHHQSRRHQSKPPAYRWPVQVFAASLVAVTGHLGGFLSGVNHP